MRTSLYLNISLKQTVEEDFSGCCTKWTGGPDPAHGLPAWLLWARGMHTNKNETRMSLLRNTHRGGSLEGQKVMERFSDLYIHELELSFR